MKLAERTFKRKDYYITSPYGNRINPVTHKEKFHNGCDYGTHLNNWNQYPLENGEVILTRTGYKDKDGNGLGNYVKIKYPRLNIQLTYGHLKEVKVKKGQQVDHNTVLGTTGMTGQATGIHLHLGLQKIDSSAWLNPEKYDYKEDDMDYKIGDIVYALDDVKLYTSIEYKESKYTIKKGEKAYIRYIKDYNIALADPDTKEYFPSAWTNELDKFSKDDPGKDYKKLYEEELARNLILQDKINSAIEILK